MFIYILSDSKGSIQRQTLCNLYRNQKIRIRFMSSVGDSSADMEYSTHNHGIFSVESP